MPKAIDPRELQLLGAILEIRDRRHAALVRRGERLAAEIGLSGLRRVKRMLDHLNRAAA